MNLCFTRLIPDQSEPLLFSVALYRCVGRELTLLPTNKELP